MTTNPHGFRHSHRQSCTIILCLAVLPLGMQVGAGMTNQWEFDHQADYMLSDSALIQTEPSSGGRVALVLQAKTEAHARILEYRTWIQSGLAFGDLGTMQLTRTPTGTYSYPGVFHSRIFDKKLAGDWQILSSDIENSVFLSQSLKGELSTNAPGLVALYHLNNSPRDEVSGMNGIPAGGYVYETRAVLGSHAGQGWNGRYLQTVNSTLLNGVSEMSIAFWIYPRETYSGRRGVLGYVQGSTQVGFYRDDNGVLGGAVILPSGYSFGSAGVGGTPISKWSFIAMTWSGATGRIRMYLNGESRGDSAAQYSHATGTLPQNTPFIVNHFTFGGSGLYCNLDEVSVWNRRLSDAEVSAMYLALSAVDLRVRSGNSQDLTGEFVGPDGSASSSYLPGNRELKAGGSFNPFDRYIQYEAKVYSDAVGSDTPRLNSLKMITSDGVVVHDSSLADFEQAENIELLTNYPVAQATPYLGLARGDGGAFVASGAYRSPVFDGGGGGFWQAVEWSTPAEVPTDATGLVGLWHMNGSWADSIGGVIGVPAGATLITDAPKLGTGAARFDGASGVAFPLNKTVRSVEFWTATQAGNSGLLELNPGSASGFIITSTNGTLRLEGGSAAGATLYVNANTRNRELLPGWNHIAIVLSANMTVTNMVLGMAAGSPWQGLADELAVYNRALLKADVVQRVASGVRQSGGRVLARVRTGNTLPLAGAFSGSYQSGQVIGIADRRYFQYELELNGGGMATPAVGNVRVVSSAGTFANVTREDFAKGEFGAATAWHGDSVQLIDLADRGAVGLSSVGQSGLAALWKMDDATWTTPGAQVLDSAGSRHGSPVGGANTESSGGLGLYSGKFSGSGQYVALPAVALPADFAVSVWFKSSATTRSALVASELTGSRSYALELNGDGTGGTVAGALTLVGNGISGQVRMPSQRRDLNDGNWHHVVAQRRGQQMHLYVDGVRENSVALSGAVEDYGAGPMYMARYGGDAIYFNGYLDDLSIWQRALDPGEIGRIAQVGFESGRTATFESGVLDAGGASIWESISWVSNGRFGVGLPSGGISLVGLWRCDDVSGSLSNAVSGGTAASATALTYGNAGIFDEAVGFSGSGAYANVPHASTYEPGAFTISAWINPEADNSRTIIQKRTLTQGYELSISAQQRLSFWLSGTTCVDPVPVMRDAWTHVAASYDGQQMRLYVDGLLVSDATPVGASVASGAALQIGRSYTGGGFYRGLMDDVAVFNQALDGTAILAQYRAGRGTLALQIRSGDTEPLDGVPYVGPDGSTNTYFLVPSAGNLVNVTGLNRYFQYRGFIRTEDHRFSPTLYGVSVSASRYPESAPWVAVNTNAAYRFVGNLTGFNHDRTYNTNTDVRYQITGDIGMANRWFYWDSSAGEWQEQDTTSGVDVFTFQTSSRSDVHAHIPEFYSQVYDKTGGDFRFKAFLKSGGDQQVSVDWVEVVASEGRVVVGFPNGEEDGDRALISSVPYDVTWSWTGKVSNALVVEYSVTGPDGPWIQITAAAPKGADGQGSWRWTTPDTIGVQQLDHEEDVYIRVRDPNDASITDRSDDAFTITRRFRVVAPNGGETWYVGQTNRIIWESSYNMQGLVQLHYAPQGTNFDRTAGGYEIEFATGNQDSNPSNTYSWAIPAGNALLLSTNGRVRVQKTTGEYADWSDESFTIAGLATVAPVAGQKVKRGEPFILQWRSIGAGDAVAIDYSANSGADFTNLYASVANSNGMNSFVWNISQGGSDFAMLRIRSLDNANAVAYSPVFVVADIDVISPDGLEVWLMGTKQNITWKAGGAGAKVSLYFRTSPTGEWFPIAEGVDNDLSYEWTVSDKVTTRARVKVQSDADTNLFAISDGNFNIAGVQVTYPNLREDTVEKNVPFYITHNASPESWAGAKIEITYDQGNTYTVIDNLSSNWTLGGPREYKPTDISRQTKIKVSVNNSPGYTNIFDTSDEFFTVAGIVMEHPLRGAVYTIGTAQQVTWRSAGANSSAEIFYSDNDTNNFVSITPQGVINNQIYPGRNPYTWNIASTITPSENARVKVVSGNYSEFSEKFTLRGVKFTAPVQGAVWDVGSNQRPAWKFAAIDPTALAKIDLSLDGGNTYPVTLATNHPLTGLPFLIWDVDPELDPSTNAMLRLTVTDSGAVADRGMIARSPVFTLRGLKVTSPEVGASWGLGTTNTIRFVSAAMGGTFTINYSSDGGDTFDPTPVAGGLQLGDGTHQVPWGIELNRRPSGDARIRIAASGGVGTSKAFALGGIRVDRPMSLDIWAAGEANTIRWVAVGTTERFDLDLIYQGGEAAPFLVNRNAGGSSMVWSVPPAAIPTGLDSVSNVVMRVADQSGVVGLSAPFMLVRTARVTVVEPHENAYWKVGEKKFVEWIRGGQLNAADFKVFYFYGHDGTDFTRMDQIDDVVVYDESRNLFRIPWTVPDELGLAKVLVTNIVNGAVADFSSEFRVAANFTVVYPNGAVDEDPIYANSRINASWTTWGSANAVNLFYSYDGGPWTLVAANIANNHTKPPSSPAFSVYEWLVPRDRLNAVKFRVQDASYGPTSTFDAATPGPYDDSDNTFPFRYFTVRWDVGYLDDETGLRRGLDKLSVSDSSGWSDSALTTIDQNPDVIVPIVRDYPYGIFDTIWYRQYFNDMVDFKWLCMSNHTRTITMVKSDTEAEPHVLADFSYDPGDDRLTAYVWMERGGRVIEEPEVGRATLFDKNGAAFSTKASTTVLEGGVFQLTWDQISQNPNIDRGGTYFARAEIDYNGVTFSSALTYRLSLSADQSLVEEVRGAITASESNIVAEVRSVGEGVDAALGMLGTVTGATGRIEGTMSNLVISVDAMSNVVVRNLGQLTNAVTVMGASVTNIEGMVSNVVQNTSADQARILTRPTTVVYGSTNAILYKTTRSLDFGTVRLSVEQANQEFLMQEVSLGLGIYEYNVIANWGLGSYTLTCSDPNTADSMVMEVVSQGSDAMAATLAMVEEMSVQLSNVTAVVKGTDSSSGIAGLLQQLGAQLSQVETSISAGGTATGGGTTTAGTSAALAGVESLLGGMTGDLMSRIDAIGRDVSSVSTKSASAEKEAALAKTAAQTAVAALQQLHAELLAGVAADADRRMAEIKAALNVANERIENIPKVIGISALREQMKLVAEQVNEMAKKEGFTGDLDLAALGEGGSGDAEEETIQTLNRQMTEMQRAMEFVRKLLEESATEPIVQEDWMGVE